MEYLKMQYRMAFAFLRGPMKKPCLFCGIVFLALCIASYFALLKLPELAGDISVFFAENVENSGVVDETGNISCVALFLHNLWATGIAALWGLVPFCFLPIITLAVNGLVIGGMLAVIRLSGSGNVLLMILLGLLPHGIAELPAMLMGMSLGITLCLHLSAGILKKPWAIPLEDLLVHLVRILLLIATPLLALAALVETYITPILLSLL